MSELTPAVETPVVAAATPADQRYYNAKRVRRSLKHYVLGRGVTALCGFAVAVLLVRALDIEQYAGYTALSGMLMALIILSNGGLERVVPRYFPQLREAGAEAELAQLCVNVTLLRIAFLAAVLIPVALGREWLARWFGLSNQAGLWGAFIGYVLAFGMSQHAAHCLQALLRQRDATLGNAIEWLSKLIVLSVWFGVYRGIALEEAMAIHALTAGAGCCYMLVRLSSHLSAKRGQMQPAPVLDRAQVVRMGGYNYLQSLAGFHAGPHAAKMLSGYLLPPIATAALGFAQSITGFLRRYLPAQLLLGLVEPAIMARYSEKRDFAQTTHLVAIIFKLNLFLLTPIAAWATLNGSPLISLITGGKYADSTWLIGAFMLVLMMESHRLVLHLISNALEKSELLLHSNLLSMVFVPLSVGATIWFGLPGLMACVGAIALSRNVYLVARLRRLGFAYRPDWAAVARIVVQALAAAAIGRFVMLALGEDLVGCAVSVIVSACVVPLMSPVLRPFSSAERDTLARVLGRRLFFL